MKTIFVIGAGNGLGNSVARKFGQNGFRVVLLARNEEHLKDYQKEFQEQQIDTDIRTVDASSTQSLTEALSELQEKYGAPDVLFYNVGVTQPDSALSDDEKTADLLMKRYMTDVAGAYHAIHEVLGEEFSQKNGTVLVTGGGLAMHPMYEFLPLSMDKAALRAMCLALHDELSKQNVHVGTVTITGTIEEDTKWDPDIIAEDFWKMYTDRAEPEIVH